MSKITKLRCDGCGEEYSFDHLWIAGASLGYHRYLDAAGSSDEMCECFDFCAKCWRNNAEQWFAELPEARRKEIVSNLKARRDR